MKNTAMLALMLNLGVAGVYAQQTPINMTFSGTAGSSTINLQQSGTNNSEDNSSGDGTFGPFTFRNVRAIRTSPEPSSTCSSPTQVYFSSVAGAGVFRFQDGSLLTVNVMDGSGCVNLTAMNAALIVKYAITGGTGRFSRASGELTMTATLMVVLRNASGAPALLTNTGKFEGAVFGVARREDEEDEEP